MNYPNPWRQNRNRFLPQVSYFPILPGLVAMVPVLLGMLMPAQQQSPLVMAFAPGAFSREP